MNFIVSIPDNGKPREAIPVRAIPWATGWTVSSTKLCSDLARNHEESEPKLWEVTAYHLDDRGNPVALLPKEWDFFLSKLRALEGELDAEGVTRGQSTHVWRPRSTLVLPPAVFMWADEVLSAFEIGISRWTFADEREGERKSNLCAWVPDELREAIMEGFERLMRAARPKPDRSVPMDNGLVVGYDDFGKLCRVSSADDLPGMDLRPDGVYIVPPPLDGLLSPGERAVLSEHPKKDLTQPALKLPCTLPKLQEFLEFFGLYGCIDPFDMADWVMGNAQRKDREEKERKGIAEELDALAAAGSAAHPPDERAILAQTQAKPVGNGVTVTLPHTTPTLEALFKIMRENWTDYDPKRAPKQTNIAAEIDAAMGWKSESDGKPSRNAKALAAAIKPTTDPEE